MPETSATLIAAYNAGREPSRLALKYRAMNCNAFSFLRGTAHLFHRRLAALANAPAGPNAWITGDMHLENYGAYLGSDGEMYFNVNDFDECALAPCTWDIVRLATSILVAAPTLGIKKESKALARSAIETYASELAKAKPDTLQHKSAPDPINELFDDAKKDSKKKFVLGKTVDGKGEKLDSDDRKIQQISDANEVEVVRQFATNLASLKDGSKLYKVKDVACRIAGTGSLGIRRYLVLVADAKSGELSLLDVKESLPSSAAPMFKVDAKASKPFQTEADRIVKIQSLAQGVPPAMLQAVTIDIKSDTGGDKSYVLKELLPTSESLKLVDVARNADAFATTVRSMASLTAWAHLRTAGQYEAAPATDLAKFAGKTGWINDAVSAADAMQKSMLEDWQNYRSAYDKGDFAKVLAAVARGKGDE